MEDDDKLVAIIWICLTVFFCTLVICNTIMQYNPPCECLKSNLKEGKK